MSETKHYSGVLVQVNQTPLDLLLKHGITEEEINKTYNNINEAFEEFLWETHIILDGDVYAFEEKQSTDDLDMCKIVVDTDGKVYYDAIFHNGGTCLTEVLQKAFKDD